MSYIESDADIARRLDMELNNPVENGTIVQRNAISQQSAQNQSPRFLSCCLAFVLIEALQNIVCLVVSRDTECDRPLRWWVMSRLLYDMQVMPNYIRRLNGASQTYIEEKQYHWVRLFEFVSFVFGQVMLFDSQTCHRTSPFLYGWTVTTISMFYIGMMAPLLLLLGICFCLPCVQQVQHILTPSPGASTEVIDSIPILVYSKDTYKKNDPEHLEAGRTIDPTCAICMEDYIENDNLRSLPCEHDFHAPCLDRWLRVNATCPQCRKHISGEEAEASLVPDTVPLTSQYL